ncbi:MAG: PepSY-associated TM helix domain-containing protein [Cyclobacteriaceae bacterium]|nr:PepSY-associated TM helix domain-containing protein [Cyclobacteriaceae bacterium]
MKLTARNTHRDIAYFFLGLIIAFSISGIFLNHRQDWHPRRYSYSIREITLPAPILKEEVTDTFVTNFTASQKIEDNLRRFSVDDKNNLRISYTMNDVQVDLATGVGKIETYRTTPLLGQMTQLHIDTNKWWIYYSDVFGLAMLTIAITGMFIERGKNSFRQRGWWLALLGLIFPLIFLFLLS